MKRFLIILLALTLLTMFTIGVSATPFYSEDEDYWTYGEGYTVSGKDSLKMYSSCYVVDNMDVYCMTCDLCVGSWSDLEASDGGIFCSNCERMVGAELFNYCTYCETSVFNAKKCPTCNRWLDQSYGEGYEAGLAAGSTASQELLQQYYDNGYAKGNEDGMALGYELGYAAATGSESGGGSGEDTDTQAIYQQGYNDGLEQARAEYEQKDAYQDGYAAGFAEAAVIKYQEGYEAGRKKGYEEGYAQGYKDGYNKAIQDSAERFQYGIFAKCSFTAKIAILDESGNIQTYLIPNFKMNYGYGYIYIGIQGHNQLADKYAEVTGTTNTANDISGIEYVEITCDFENEFDYNIFPMYTTSANAVPYISLKYDASENMINCELDTATTEQYKKYKLPNYWFGNTWISQVIIKIPNQDTNIASFMLYSPSGQYFNGYDVGYAAGSKNENSASYAKGYQDGVIDGKKEGIEISKTGDWKNLISAVIEAPVNAFQSLFNFEILGLDMRAAVGSILALCVLLIIIKKVIL